MYVSTTYKIFRSNKYDMFKFYESNRVYRDNQRLESEILKNNKLHFNPIIVDKDFYVIDGQHRLKIAEKYGLDVFFMIDDEGGEDDIKELQSSRCWRQADYLHHWAKRGAVPYIFMEECIEKYDISISCFLKAFAVNTYKDHRGYKGGKMVLKLNVVDIREVLEGLMQIKKACREFLKKEMHMAMELAFIRLLCIPNFDADEMIRKICIYPDYLIKAYAFRETDNITTILLDDIYNRKKRNPISL